MYLHRRILYLSRTSRVRCTEKRRSDATTRLDRMPPRQVPRPIQPRTVYPRYTAIYNAAALRHSMSAVRVKIAPAPFLSPRFLLSLSSSSSTFSTRRPWSRVLASISRVPRRGIVPSQCCREAPSFPLTKRLIPSAHSIFSLAGRPTKPRPRSLGTRASPLRLTASPTGLVISINPESSSDRR